MTETKSEIYFEEIDNETLMKVCQFIRENQDQECDIISKKQNTIFSLKRTKGNSKL